MAKRGAKTKGPVLSPKQRKAIDEYFKNGFKKRPALIAAGYAVTTATSNSQSVFSNPLVRDEIDRRIERDRRKYQVDRDWVLQRYARIADGGEILARYKVVNEDGSVSWDFTDAPPEDLAAIQNMQTDTYMDGRGDKARQVKKMKIEMADQKGALDSLSRMLGLFQDKVEVSGEVSIVERLQAGRRRVGSREAKEG